MGLLPYCIILGGGLQSHCTARNSAACCIMANQRSSDRTECFLKIERKDMAVISFSSNRLTAISLT